MMQCTRCGTTFDHRLGCCPNCNARYTYMQQVMATQAYQQKNATRQQRNQVCHYGAPTPKATAKRTPQRGERKFGLGGAIFSVIFAELAILLSVIINAFATTMLELLTPMLESGEINTESLLAALSVDVKIAFAILAVGILFSIIGLALGIKSIKRFKRRKKEGYAKPVATLVLGIYGTISAVTAIFSNGAWIALLALLFVLI